MLKAINNWIWDHVLDRDGYLEDKKFSILMGSRFRLLRDAPPEAKAGMIVYRCSGSDFGLAAEDAERTGVPHVSVTLDSAGGYPVFTVPVDCLEVAEG